MKKLLATFAMLIASVSASASSLSIVGGGDPVSFSGYNPTPSITGTYTTGYLGQLEALVAGVFSATYLGQESGYKNGFSFDDGWFRLGRALDSTSSQISLNEYSAIGTTINSDVAAGVLDFWFRDSSGGYIANDGSGSRYRKASFAILDGQCITNFGCFDYILGFNDSYKGDADYDDFVVGVKLSPVPLPAAAWLFGSALFGFIAVSNRRKV